MNTYKKTIQSNSFEEQFRKIREFRKRVGERNIIRADELKVIEDGQTVWTVDIYYKSHLKLLD
jgi:hypothetical protein